MLTDALLCSCKKNPLNCTHKGWILWYINYTSKNYFKKYTVYSQHCRSEDTCKNTPTTAPNCCPAPFSGTPQLCAALTPVLLQRPSPICLSRTLIESLEWVWLLAAPWSGALASDSKGGWENECLALTVPVLASSVCDQAELICRASSNHSKSAWKWGNKAHQEILIDSQLGGPYDKHF